LPKIDVVAQLSPEIGEQEQRFKRQHNIHCKSASDSVNSTESLKDYQEMALAGLNGKD
jgi:hypothetical protein